MSNIVVDTSVIVKWLNQKDELYLKQADKLLSNAEVGTATLFAPQLAKYEVGNALLNKKLDLPLALDALGTASRLPINFVAETPELASETYSIATENAGITYYDASFMALAKQEKATLVTDNPKHQKRISGVKVRVLKNYR